MKNVDRTLSAIALRIPNAVDISVDNICLDTQSDMRYRARRHENAHGRVRKLDG
jgi:hypothetical protein